MNDLAHCQTYSLPFDVENCVILRCERGLNAMKVRTLKLEKVRLDVYKKSAGKIISTTK